MVDDVVHGLVDSFNAVVQGVLDFAIEVVTFVTDLLPETVISLDDGHNSMVGLSIVNRVRIHGKGGNDTLTVWGVRGALHGDEGNDTLIAGCLIAEVHGWTGDDTIKTFA